MSFEIIWSNGATSSLVESLEYVKSESPIAADRLKREIEETVLNLKRFPFIGPIYERDEFRRIRELICEPFRIFYRVYQERSRVVILRVWHASRDEPTRADLLA